MTQDEIIEMARQAWLSDSEAQLITEFDEAYISCTYLKDLTAFAKLAAQHERKRMAWTQDHWTEYEHNIASAEREACAQLAQDNSDWYGDVATIADLIRARGQA